MPGTLIAPFPRRVCVLSDEQLERVLVVGVCFDQWIFCRSTLRRSARRRLFRPMDFCTARLRHFIEQSLARDWTLYRTAIGTRPARRWFFHRTMNGRAYGVFMDGV